MMESPNLKTLVKKTIMSAYVWSTAHDIFEIICEKQDDNNFKNNFPVKRGIQSDHKHCIWNCYQELPSVSPLTIFLESYATKI